MPSQSRTHFLFDRAANEQSRHESQSAGNIRCGLCWEFFSEDALTIDHVPPSSTAKLVGEKPIRVLTCARCNNEMGTTTQSDLKKLIEFELFLTGRQPYPFKKWKVAVGGADPLTVESEWTLAGIRFVGVPKANNQSVTNEHMRILSNAPLDLKITVEGKFHRPERASLALIVSAYLTIVALTKYGYGYSRAGKAMRALIHEGVLVGPSNYCVVAKDAPIFGETWVGVLTDPAEYEAVWVKVAGHIIIMPTPNSDADVYERYWSISRNPLPFSFGLQPNLGKTSISFGSEMAFEVASKSLPQL